MTMKISQESQCVTISNLVRPPLWNSLLLGKKCRYYTNEDEPYNEVGDENIIGALKPIHGSLKAKAINGINLTQTYLCLHSLKLISNCISMVLFLNIYSFNSKI